MKIYKTLKDKFIELYGEHESSAISFLLLEKHCGIGMTDVVMGKDECLDDGTVAELYRMSERIANGEPVQYVLGKADFCGHTFNVAPGVLIPRPETEELVEWICQDYTDTVDKQSLRLLDIGTGSGCIAISLARRLCGTKVEAWDISETALRIAEKNAEIIGAEVVFRQRDVLAPLFEMDMTCRYSAIVSNPPYICEEERTGMERNVLEHEPSTALFVPDNDPLLFYRAIAEKATKMLYPGGALYFEINSRFSLETAELMRTFGFTQIETKRDFMNKERMIKGIFKGEE